MAIVEKHGAKGSMILNHDWYEDSQGVNEYFNNCAKIEADPDDDTFVLMTIEDGKADFRKGYKQDKTVVRISTLDLINLMQKNGKNLKL